MITIYYRHPSMVEGLHYTRQTNNDNCFNNSDYHLCNNCVHSNNFVMQKKTCRYKM